MYTRAVYSFYPRKVYAVDDNTKVESPEDITDSDFHPTKQWLLDHKVNSVVVFTILESGEVRTKVKKNLWNTLK